MDPRVHPTGLNKKSKMNPLAQKYYWRWRDCVARSRYLEWREIQDEFAAECEFAMNNDMETEFWCWNCKHSCCDRHESVASNASAVPFKQKQPGCAGKTQRGRNCHFKITSYACGKFYCRYHHQ